MFWIQDYPNLSNKSLYQVYAARFSDRGSCRNFLQNEGKGKAMLLEFKQLKLQPGQQLLLENISWQQFEDILAEIGEACAARLSYSNGHLEVIVPLPEHEKVKEIISDMIKILLNQQSSNYEALGSTTFKNQQMSQAVEPDNCFYIQNQAAVVGKNRLDMTSDPPPDLVVKIDLTSRTRLDNYRLLGVPELWWYSQGELKIYLLRDSAYVESFSSPTFPQVPVIELVNRYVQQSQSSGSSQAVQAFRNWVGENL